jgi:hypothetical protein
MFLPSALLARQQPVDAEAAASGHERENECGLSYGRAHARARGAYSSFAALRGFGAEGACNLLYRPIYSSILKVEDRAGLYIDEMIMTAF